MKKFWEKLSTSDVRNNIAIAYVFLVLAYIYVLAFSPVPERNKDLINVLGGNVLGGVGLILAYYFGASKNDKNETKP